MKNNKRFDRIIQDKLEHLPVEYNPESWDLLEQKLDGTPASSGTDQSLEEVLYEKLSRLHYHDRPAQWEKLAARLDEEQRIRGLRLRQRLMTAVLVLLFILTFVQYFPTQEPYGLLGRQWGPLTSIIENKHSEPTTTAPAALSEATMPKPNAAGVASENEFANESNGSVAQTSASVLKSNLDTSPKIPNVKLQSPTPEKPAESIKDLHGGPTVSHAPIPRTELMEALSNLMLEELSSPNQPDYPVLIKPTVRRRSLLVSMFGSVDYNRIITPATMRGDAYLRRHDRYAQGYGGGLMLDVESSRWALGGGFIYSAKQYLARPVLYRSGNIQTGYDVLQGIKDVELNILQIPLHARYNFIKKDKWRVYATAGASLQVAFQANYYISDQEPYRDAGFALPPTPQRPSQPIPAPPAIDNLPSGWFEGGAFFDNAYLTSNVGIGVERFITPRWSIFGQPTYQHAINLFAPGLGPDKERIHTMSLFTGVRVKL